MAGLCFKKKEKGISPEETILEEEIVPEEESVPEEEIPGEEKKFGLSGRVLRVDVENNWLIVKSVEDEKELKLIISEDTELIRIEDPEDVPEAGYVVSKKTEIKLSDFREGDIVSLRTAENIAGKTEIGTVIHIYLYSI